MRRHLDQHGEDHETLRRGELTDAAYGPAPNPIMHPAPQSPKNGRHAGLARNIFFLYVLQGLNYVVPMAVLPYLVRVLGMESYGLIAFSQSFAQYFTLLTDYGFNYSATRSIAKSEGNETQISRLFWSVLLIKVLLMIAGAIIMLAIVSTVPRFHQNTSFFVVAYLGVLGSVLFPTWYFQGIERMGYISGIIGFSRLAAAVALFVFVHHPSDALLALGIQSGSLLLGGIAGMWAAVRRSNLHFRKPALDDLTHVLRDGWHLFVSSAAVSLYTNTNVFLVGLLAGNLEAGYFSAAEKLIRALQGLITPISQALFPHMNSLACHSRQLALQLARRTLQWMACLSFAAGVVLFALAAPIVSLCFGHGAAGTLSVVRWIAFLPFFISISNVLGVQTMVTFGFDKQFSRILIAAGLFNLALAIPLIHLFAASGAACSVLCTEFLVTVTMITLLKRYGFRLFSEGSVA